MINYRRLWARLVALRQWVATAVNENGTSSLGTRTQRHVPTAVTPNRTSTPAANGASPPTDLTEIQKELRKLSKVQFKANTLVENQTAQWAQMVTAVQETQQQNEKLLALVKDGRETAVAQQLLGSILPALDSIEEAIKSGQQYLAVRDRASQAPSLTPEKARQLVSPADRAILAAWLDGLRLIQERHLAVLEAGGVTAIPTVGRPFDPFKHRAVSTKPAGENPPNSIACEERRGYETANGVLRYADVVVYK